MSQPPHSNDDTLLRSIHDGVKISPYQSSSFSSPTGGCVILRGATNTELGRRCRGEESIGFRFAHLYNILNLNRDEGDRRRPLMTKERLSPSRCLNHAGSLCAGCFFFGKELRTGVHVQPSQGTKVPDRDGHISLVEVGAPPALPGHDLIQHIQFAGLLRALLC